MNNKGFTLIELLVVIAIIGILATVIIVFISGTRDDAADALGIATVQEAGLAFRVEQTRRQDNLYPSFNSLITVPTSTVATLSGIVIADPGLISDSYCVSYELRRPDLDKEFYVSSDEFTGYQSSAIGGC